MVRRVRKPTCLYGTSARDLSLLDEVHPSKASARRHHGAVAVVRTVGRDLRQDVHLRRLDVWRRNGCAVGCLEDALRPAAVDCSRDCAGKRGVLLLGRVRLFAASHAGGMAVGEVLADARSAVSICELVRVGSGHDSRIPLSFAAQGTHRRFRVRVLDAHVPPFGQTRSVKLFAPISGNRILCKNFEAIIFAPISENGNRCKFVVA